MTRRYLISGGGTGGGVYPALAVVAAIKAQQPTAEFLWLGTRSGLDRELVTRAGIPFEAVPGGPLAGVNVRALLSSVQISAGMVSALAKIRRFKPDAMLITGGWPCIAPTFAARMLGVPVMIYSPDVEPAGTIKALARYADKIAVNHADSAAYYASGAALVETGYPIRPDLLQAAGYDVLGQSLADWDEKDTIQRARERFDLTRGRPTLLVFGGSRGARSINNALIESIPELIMPEGHYSGCQIVHISGTLDWDRISQFAADLPPDLATFYYPVAYLHTEDMALVFAAADLVVARAGAGTIGEFPLFRLPAILVPYPHAWRYQKVNADVMASRGAAIRLNDEDLSDDLTPLVRRLLTDDAERTAMAEAMSQLKVPAAAANVAAVFSALASTEEEKSL